MTVYIPQYSQRLPLYNPCDIAATQELTGSPQLPCTPHIFPVPLPGESSPVSSPGFPELRRTNNYPLNIFRDLSLSQKQGLQAVELTTPIHVHTPHAHIGIITIVPLGQRILASDVVTLLQSVAVSQLDLHHTFSHLSVEMMGKVKGAFYRRKVAAQQNNYDDIWFRFITGQSDVNGPLGIDVLLGNNEVWGFEGSPLGGYSVVHLAGEGFMRNLRSVAN